MKRLLKLIILLLVLFPMASVSAQSINFFNTIDGTIASADIIDVEISDSDALKFCKDTNNLQALKYVGIALGIIKILIPILLIIFGTIDMSKAVLSNNDEQIKKSAVSFGIRIVAGIIVFFVPTVVYALLNLVASNQNNTSNYIKCYECVFKLNC